MSRRSWSSRFTTWAAVGLLLLKAAVPLLAAGAAHARGVPVAQVCAIYGVALAAHGAHAGHPHDGAHEGHAAPAGDDDGARGDALHGSGHCALAALASLSTPDAAAPALPSARDAAPAFVEPSRAVARPDACASWAARLRHGPPARA